MRWLPACCLFVAAASFSATAVGQAPTSAHRLTEQGAQLYADLRFEEALKVLKRASLAPDITTEQFVRAQELLAYSHLALGQEHRAARAWRRLLARRPDFEASQDVAPRFRKFFREARSAWEWDGRPGLDSTEPVAIAHRAPTVLSTDQGLIVEAVITDPAGQVVRLVLAHRSTGGDAYQRSFALCRHRRCRALLGSDALNPPFLEYYLQAVDAEGEMLASLGDADEPLRLAVPERDSGGGVLTKWWFWTGAAAVVAGGVVAAILLSQSDGSQSEEQGTLRVTVE